MASIKNGIGGDLMKPFKVNEVNTYIKRVLTTDMILSNIQVEGEISNFKHHNSGHMYFSLKDDRSRIKCVMFKTENERLLVNLEEGMKVVASGYISVFERDGEYQLYVRKVEEKGIGDLYKAYDLLKNKLQKEGLFDVLHKKEIPSMPKKIGLVTSSTGAAVRDIISIIKRRCPPCKILIYPSLVQGPDAPCEIIKGLKYLDSLDDIDLIITGRGGGSIEELFAFNDEDLARCIFNLRTPIISAVGHEIDFTIADFVADLRAPTPSAAAELAVPDMTNLYEDLSNKYYYLSNYIINRLRDYKADLNMYERGLKYNNPILKLREKNQEVDILYRRLIGNINNKLNKEYRRSAVLENKLNLLNPNISLEKGFGILYKQDGKAIKSIDEINLDEEIRILLKDGELKTLVLEIEKRGVVDGD